MTSAERVARNIAANYGREALRWLIAGFDTETSMAKMGRDFARFNRGQPLTRERLRQWRKALGVRVTFYEVEPVVRKVLDSTVVKSTREQ